MMQSRCRVLIFLLPNTPILNQPSNNIPYHHFTSQHPFPSSNAHPPTPSPFFLSSTFFYFLPLLSHLSYSYSLFPPSPPHSHHYTYHPPPHPTLPTPPSFLLLSLLPTFTPYTHHTPPLPPTHTPS